MLLPLREGSDWNLLPRGDTPPPPEQTRDPVPHAVTLPDSTFVAGNAQNYPRA